jgi:hypothetical protein
MGNGKRAAYLTGVLFFIFLQSCFLFPPDSEIPDYPIPNDKIRIFCNAYPNTSVAGGETPFSVYVQFDDLRPGAEENAFADADITANGIHLAPLGVTDNYFLASAGISLGQGDDLTVIIKHSIVGTITLTGTVPEGVSDFTLDPVLPAAGIENSGTSYTMSWAGNGADEYSPKCFSYDSTDDMIRGRGYYTTNTSYIFGAGDIEEGGLPIPYFDFKLAAIDLNPIDDFASGSAMRVESALVPLQSNRPE